MEQPDLMLEAYNELCGDQFTLYLQLENDRISDISFHGYGCAISKASTSVLAQTLLGQTVADAKHLTAQFLAFVKGETTAPPGPADFLAFQAAKDFPTRMKCATLSWEELDWETIGNRDDSVSSND